MNLLLLREYLFALVARTHRYQYGGDDPIQGFDCSGLACEFLMASGVFKHGTRMSSQQLHDHFLANGHPGQGGLGALVFFGSGPHGICHVGICVDEIFMIEAGGGDSQVTSDEAAIARNAFVKMRPISYRKDLVATISPSYELLKTPQEVAEKH
jgi:hypothetical protein